MLSNLSASTARQADVNIGSQLGEGFSQADNALAAADIVSCMEAGTLSHIMQYLDPIPAGVVVEFYQSLRQPLPDSIPLDTINANVDGAGNAPTEKLIQTANGSPRLIPTDPAQQERAARYLFTAPDILHELAKAGSLTTQALIVNNINTTPATIAYLVEHGSEAVHIEIAASDRATPQMLDTFAHTGSEALKFDVARNENTAAETLLYLAKQASEEVQLEITNNGNTSTEKLQYLVENGSEEVRDAAQERLNPTPSETARTGYSGFMISLSLARS